ncbi:hypothetical protein C8R46DRAFT_1207896 [Mycena filopes]|nr:hypothetical protein C8R46DRAFT_1207896 [Mycena filopes]
MRLHDLSEDEIRCIFTFCDISAVVAMGRTNKRLRLLTLDKLVWLELVKNLRRKGFLHRLSLSDLQACSQEALVDLVKRISSGPACWNPTFELKSGGILSRKPRRTESVLQTGVQSVIHPSGMVFSKKNEAKLLDGGEYVLFNNQTLECWSVRHDKRIWTYEKNDPDAAVCEFAGEIVDQGDSVNIIVTERKYRGATVNPNFIQILKLNFATGLSTALYRRGYSDLDADACAFKNVKICGPLASARVLECYGNDRRERCILINWETKSQVILTSTTLTYPLLVALIPNHVLFLTNNASSHPEVRVIHTPTTLASHWRPAAFDRVLDSIDISKLEPVICESITFGKPGRFRGGYYRRELCAYGSPLEEGTYRVWISLHGSYKPQLSAKYGPGVICSYHLSLPKNAGDRPLWQQRTAAFVKVEIGLDLHESGIAYSGHRQQYHRYPDHYTIFAPRNPPHLAVLPDPNGSHYAHLSTYGGALTYFNANERTVCVCYAEYGGVETEGCIFGGLVAG